MSDQATDTYVCAGCDNRIVDGQHYIELRALVTTAGFEEVGKDLPPLKWDAVVCTPACAVMALVESIYGHQHHWIDPFRA